MVGSVSQNRALAQLRAAAAQLEVLPTPEPATASPSRPSSPSSRVTVLQGLVQSLGRLFSGSPAGQSPSTPSPATGSPTNPGAPASPDSTSGTQGSTSQPGAPVGDFQTRHWGGTEQQFDRVYQFDPSLRVEV